MSIFAAVRERKPRRIAEAARRAMHHLRDQGKRAYRASPYPRRQQQIGEIRWRALGRRSEIAVQAP